MGKRSHLVLAGFCQVARKLLCCSNQALSAFCSNLGFGSTSLVGLLLRLLLSARIVRKGMPVRSLQTLISMRVDVFARAL